MIRISSPAVLAALVAMAAAGEVPAQQIEQDLPPGDASGASPGPAASASVDVDHLRRILTQQGEQLDAQARQIEEQAKLLESYRQALDEHRTKLDAMQLQLVRGAGKTVAQAEGQTEGEPQAQPAPAQGQGQAQPSQPAQSQPAESQQAAPEDAATRPEAAEERPPEVTIIRDRGGVLTAEGKLFLEPEFEYTHQSENRFLFQGVEIVEAVLIGFIEATSATRNSWTAGLSARYGVTSRFEVGTRVPYVIREDRVTNEVLAIDERLGEIRPNAADIGDIEVSAHYQINDGQEGWPFFIANARFKSDTGTGPFDVMRDDRGIETELPTGSGFLGFEPSVTVIYPSDPAVLFANLGYSMNLAKDVSQRIGDSFIGTVDPGDSISMSFGIGIGLNEMVSVSFGYEHSWVRGTTSQINGVSAISDDLQVGSLLFGISAAVADAVGVNLNVAAGLTESAPDVRISIRVPTSVFDLFEGS